MSRTANTKKYRLSAIFGQLVVLMLVFCLSAPKAPADVFPTLPQQPITDFDVWLANNGGLIIWNNGGWTLTYYYYDHVAQGGHLRLGVQYPDSYISIRDSKYLTFENNTELTRNGGAVYIWEGNRLFETRGGNLYFTDNSTAGDGGAIYTVGATMQIHGEARSTSVAYYGKTTPYITIRRPYYVIGGAAGTDPGTGRTWDHYTPNTSTAAAARNKFSDPFSTLFTRYDVPAISDDPVTLSTSIVFQGNSVTGDGIDQPASGGGAIFNQSGSIEFWNTSFLDNSAFRASGGAIYNDGERALATLTFDIPQTGDGRVVSSSNAVASRTNDTTTWTTPTAEFVARHNVFERNDAGEHGGAIYNEHGTLSFNSNATANLQTTATVNNANSTNRPDRLSNFNSVATSNAGFFRDNHADLSGGALYNNRGLLTISATTFTPAATSSATANNDMGNGLAHIVVTNVLNATANSLFFTGNTADRYGGALYHNPNIDAGPLRFVATANPITGTATATANSNVAGGTVGGEAIATDILDATSSANAGIFRYNRAALDGGAFYNAGGIVEFVANAVGATATANATASAQRNATDPVSRAFATAQATVNTNANAGEFTENTAGADGFGNYTQFGGAIYNEWGTLRFTANASAAAATANATANWSGNGYAYAWANAFAYAYASGSDFTGNLAELGGGIYNDNGTLTFAATSAVTTTAGVTFSGTGDWRETEVRAEARAYGATFTENMADIDGGAIYNLGGTLTFTTAPAVSTSATITSSAAFPPPHGGTTINTSNSIWQDTWVEFQVNPGSGWGRNLHAVSDVAAAVFRNNVALGKRGTDTGRGGAIFNTNTYHADGTLNRTGTVVFNGITKFFGNAAETDGGALYNDGGIIEFNANASGYSTFDGNGYYAPLNIQTERGGAIFNRALLDDQGELIGGIIQMGTVGTVRPDRHGYFIRNVAALFGGAIFNDTNASIDLSRVDFRENRAGIAGTGIGDGGAVYNNDGDISFAGGIFSTNSAERFGGAIYFDASAPASPGDPRKLLNLDGSNYYFLFEFNEALSAGGALYLTQHADLNITDVIFLQNSASQTGGAIYTEGSGTITNSRFEENNDILSSGVLAAGKGGAIYNTATGSLTLTNNVFSENSVSMFNPSGQGGALYNLGSILDSEMNTFIGNWAYSGGAIYNTSSGGGGIIEMSDSLFERNDAQFGGAIYNDRGTITLNRVTFSENQTFDAGTAAGGAIYTDTGTLNLTDVNFISNVVQDTGGLGGAIYAKDSTIDFLVTEGTTITFEGNIREYSGVWGTSWENESIYFTDNNTFNVDVERNGLLAMYDPMTWAAGSVVDITKEGTGEWRLAGNNEFIAGTGTVNFAVDEGMLYLYQYTYDRSVPGPAPPVLVPVSATLNLGSGDFTLGYGATLAVDGAASLTEASSITANRIDLLGNNTLIFNNVTGIDYNRNAAGGPGSAVLTLSGNNTVGEISAASVFLFGTNLGGVPGLDWYTWFRDLNGELLLVDNGSGTGLPGITTDVVRVDLNGDRYTVFRQQGYVNTFVVRDGWLRFDSIQVSSMDVYWTGDQDNVWDTTTENWHGEKGSVITKTFYDTDNVLFDDYYYDIDGNILGTAQNKEISLGFNAVAGALEVTGRDYVFNLSSGVTLRSEYDSSVITRPTGHMDFGSATVNMGVNTAITADRTIDFGAGAMLNVGAAGTSSAQVTSGTSITFAGDTVLGNTGGIRFDLTGATVGQPPMLTLNAPTINMNNSFHHIAQTMGDLISTVTLQSGQFITLINTAGSVSGLNSIVMDFNGNVYIPQRADGVLYEFVVTPQNDLILRGSPSAGWNLMWTGNVGNGVWDTQTSNWLGQYNSSFTQLDPNRWTDKFGNGDFVLFDDTYIDENGDHPPVHSNKHIIIGGNMSLVEVGAMGVQGTEYEFTFVNGVTLSSDTSIAFGTATVNMRAGSTITANDMVAFGTLDDTATISAALGTTISADTILFTHEHDFMFDLAGADDQDVILKLEGNVSVATPSGLIGGGNIFVDNLPPAFGIAGGTGHVVLLQVDGAGAVTDTGSLMVWNPLTGRYEANTPQRSPFAGDTMLGLGVNDPSDPKELWLLVADANGNTDLYWTGNDGILWDTVSTNWTGVLNGINVSTFWHGDSVVFDNRAGENKTVVTTGEMQVGSVIVADTGYIFDLRQGGIAAEKLTWLDGRETNGAIDFGSGTTFFSGVNTVVSAEGTITFGKGMTFEFDLSDALAGDVILDLQGTVIVDENEKIGSGNIYVFNTPMLESENYVILVDAEAGNVVRTGTLYLWDPYKFDNTGWRDNPYTSAQRSTTPGIMMFGLDTNEDDSQLLLKWIDASTNSYNLTWTGAGNRIWDVESQNNWKGTVEGIFDVTTFLNGDTVYFDNTAVNKNVILGEDGVRVHSMFVQGGGYNYDMRLGGIDALGNPDRGERGIVNLNDASLLISVRYEQATEAWQDPIVVGFTQITADVITVSGTRVELADASKIDPKLILQSEEGYVDFEILVSKEEAIEGSVVSDVKIAHNPFYIGEFFIDNERTPGSGFGILRLKYFYFEGWNHNTDEAAKALNVLRGTWIAEDESTYDLFNALAANPTAAANQLRGSELVANSAALAMWNPWEITHQRLRTIRNETGWNTWGQAYYRFANYDTDNNALKFDLYRGGTMIGADYGANRYWQFGGTFGYAIPRIENAYGKIDADDVTVGLYSKINFFDQAYVSTFLGYGYQNYKMERLGFEGYTHRGAYDGDAGYASVEFSRPLLAGSVGALIPLVAFDHQTVWTNQFTETGQWGQSMAGTRMGRTMLRFGVDSKWDAGDVMLFGTFDVSTRLQFAVLIDGDRKSTVASYFPMTGASMNLYGTDMGWAQANIGVTASGEYRSKYRWFVDMDAYATDRMLALQGALGLSTRW